MEAADSAHEQSAGNDDNAGDVVDFTMADNVELTADRHFGGSVFVHSEKPQAGQPGRVSNE